MQLFRQIFFDMEVVLGFIASIAVFYYNIHSFPQEVASIDPTKNKSKRFDNDYYRCAQSELAMAKRAGLQTLVCCIVFFSMLLDGVQRTNLIGIILGIIALFILPAVFLLAFYFSKINNSLNISVSHIHVGSGAFLHSIFLGGSFVSSIAFTCYVLFSYIL